MGCPVWALLWVQRQTWQVGQGTLHFRRESWPLRKGLELRIQTGFDSTSIKFLLHGPEKIISSLHHQPRPQFPGLWNGRVGEVPGLSGSSSPSQQHRHRSPLPRTADMMDKVRSPDWGRGTCPQREHLLQAEAQPRLVSGLGSLCYPWPASPFYRWGGKFHSHQSHSHHMFQVRSSHFSQPHCGVCLGGTTCGHSICLEGSHLGPLSVLRRCQKSSRVGRSCSPTFLWCSLERECLTLGTWLSLCPPWFPHL